MGKTVLASGVFDIVHQGHIKYLEGAKRCAGTGGKLVVVVARDATVTRLKGKRPVFGERQRAFIVSSLKPVDEVVLGYDDTNLERAIRRVVLKIKPDIIAFGHDQLHIVDLTRKVVSDLPEGSVKLVRIRKFRTYTPGKSSSIKRYITKTNVDRHQP